MANKRLYEVAQEFKISSNALISVLKELNFSPKSHMSVASDEMLAAIKNKFEVEKEAVKKQFPGAHRRRLGGFGRRQPAERHQEEYRQ